MRIKWLQCLSHNLNQVCILVLREKQVIKMIKQGDPYISVHDGNKMKTYICNTLCTVIYSILHLSTIQYNTAQ